jgi:hypothetical protein
VRSRESTDGLLGRTYQADGTVWTVERVVHFEPGDFIRDGVAHFGFHVGDHYYAVDHQRHVVALLGDDGEAVFTVAAEPSLPGVPNVAAALEFPMYVDELPDGTILVSNFLTAQLYRVDPRRLTAELLVDGIALGMTDMGNCVVDGAGTIWTNEVRGCRVRRFSGDGRLLLTLGDGERGFAPEPVGFDDVRFGWIYDLRRGPDATIVVLDSGNFAVRAIDPAERVATTLAGDGTPGLFGSDPSAPFDGPISLAVDEEAIVYVGDRFHHVVRAIGPDGTPATIAGRADADDSARNDPGERDPLRLNLPQISSMDYCDGRLFVPTDLDGDAGDLAVLRRR